MSRLFFTNKMHVLYLHHLHAALFFMFILAKHKNYYLNNLKLHSMTETKPHHGRNIKRFREWAGIKQEALAAELNWSQQKISLLEQKEEVEDDVLEEVAKILKVPVEAIKKLDDAAAVNIISNTFNNNSHDSSSFYSSAINYQPSFNPIDKVVELYESKIALYERMLKDRDTMIEELKKMNSTKA